MSAFEEHDLTEAEMEAKEYAEAEEDRKQKKHDLLHGTGPRPERSTYATAAAQRSAELNKPTDMYVIFANAEDKQRMVDFLLSLDAEKQSPYAGIRKPKKSEGANKFEDPKNPLGIKLEFSQILTDLPTIEAQVKQQFNGVVQFSELPENIPHPQHPEYVEPEKIVQIPKQPGQAEAPEKRAA